MVRIRKYLDKLISFDIQINRLETVNKRNVLTQKNRIFKK